MGETAGFRVQQASRAKMGCQNCMIRCSQITKVWDGPYKGVWSEGPEYETLWSFSGPIGKAEIGLTVLADRLVTNWDWTLFQLVNPLVSL